MGNGSAAHANSYSYSYARWPAGSYRDSFATNRHTIGRLFPQRNATWYHAAFPDTTRWLPNSAATHVATADALLVAHTANHPTNESTAAYKPAGADESATAHTARDHEYAAAV